MELLLLYLWVQLDEIRHFLAVLTPTLSVLATISLFAGWCYRCESQSSYKAKDDRTRCWDAWVALRKWSVTGAWVAFLCAFLYAVTPTSKGLAYIVGGYITVEAIKSPEAKRLGQAVYNRVLELLEPEKEPAK